MRTDCRRTQELLAEGGLSRVRDDDAAIRHGVECPACFELFLAFDQLDRTLAELPLVDAPDSVVAALQDRLRREAGAAPPLARPGRLRVSAYGGGAAAALLLVVAGGLYLSGDLQESLRRITQSPPPGRIPATAPQDIDTGLADRTPSAPGARPAGPTAMPPAPPPAPIVGGRQASDFGRPWLEVARDRRDDGYTPQGSAGAARPNGAEALSASTSVPGPAAAQRPKLVAPDPPAGRGRPATPEPGLTRTATSSGLDIQVVDADGSPLPGATVTLSHESGQVRAYTVLSDRRGAASFPVLKPGTGYIVEVGMASFGTRRESGIRVPVGSVGSQVIQLSDAMAERVRVVASQGVVELEESSSSTKFSDPFVQDLPLPGRFYQNVLTLAPGVSDPDGDGNPTVHGSRSRDFKAVVGGVRSVDPLTGQFLSLVTSDSIEEFDVITGGAGVDLGHSQGGFARVIQRAGSAPAAPAATPLPPPDTAGDVAAARAFLAERGSVDGIPTRTATGHWLNRYVPGDPTLRLLQARLAGPAGVRLGLGPVARLPLHERVRRVRQPFDAPQAGALAVNLRCDRRGVEGRSRALVQVGLQASTRHGGRRPALNLGIVLDLGGDLPLATTAGLRSLLAALAGAKDVGDRFNLIVAGLPQRISVAPDDFRYGFLSVSLADWLAQSEGREPGREFAVNEALREAIEAVGGVDDPSTPIGSSAVIVVTSRALTGSVESLVGLAHHGAVAGIPISVIGIGEGLVPAELERLTLAGQGSLRLLTLAADAPALVDRELSAASRAVARAVRVNIRLAPGVQLVDVIGSRPLRAPEATRVRQAEQSIDRRLLRNLGIAADRKDDDPGIQILIPTFYSGDSHVILLDVIAAGGGPVAEVDVRFKDLVHSGNGVSRDSLTLEEAPSPGGPLEHNVLRNLLALRLAEVLGEAGARALHGDPQGAAGGLRGFRAVLRGLPQVVPALAGDAELLAERDLLTDYLTALEQTGPGRPHSPETLSDSLSYAGLLTLLPRPVF